MNIICIIHPKKFDELNFMRQKFINYPGGIYFFILLITNIKNIPGLLLENEL